ncbi:MAG: aminotransferase class V-fold PLP-dependent enzyme [Roseivirga sp.]|nr:aminotransferase class V-fold PLP-dependent enzyme [Roseivirga sp.]
MLENQSYLFNLPEDTTYLNCAYMSPMLKSVAQKGIHAIYGKEDPTSIKPEDFFNNTSQLREEFARLIEVANPNQCAIIPSVSYGMATVANNLKAGNRDNIVVTDEQFPSNVYAWHAMAQERGIEVKVVTPPLHEERGKHWNQSILEAINAQTKMVAIGHVHWADGTRFDLKAIRQRTREVGAILVIDGTQSIGALPFSVREFEPDAVIVAGYKWLMGPYSSGVAYYGDYFADGKPIENNWMNRLKSEEFANLVNYQDQYQPGSIRYEVGESANFILTPMLTEAIRQINAWGPENIQAYCSNLTDNYLRELQEMGFQVETPEYRGNHLFGIRLPEHLPLEPIKNYFARQKVFVSYRGNSIRVAPHVYNTAVDMEALMAGFHTKAFA